MAELKTLDDAKIEDAFYRDLAFGTGGLRGVIGAGTNRMNVYTVAKASQGLADYLKKNFAEPSVAIGYDSRIKSDVFAKVAAGVFAANGVKVNIWLVLMPVPTVSFATRYAQKDAERAGAEPEGLRQGLLHGLSRLYLCQPDGQAHPPQLSEPALSRRTQRYDLQQK